MVRLELFACAALTLIQLYSVAARTASDIAKCPKLAPRKSSPTSVRDLRPDDITVFMALGDSITAGFAAKGLAPGIILNINNLNEDRGVSYAVGGDPGAITLPNLFGHYTSNVGASVGEHLVELCYGILCPPFQYHPSQDHLNAAQSGALAANLQHEFDDYLLPNLKKYPGVDFENDWKFLNLQIGSNDLCLSCIAGGLLSPDDYEGYVRNVLESIRTKIPKIVVNLASTFNVSRVYEKTLNQSYCQLVPGFPHLNIECGCALLGGSIGEQTRAVMDEHTAAYNARLLKIRNDYAAKYPNGTFGIVYQPANVNFDTVPIQFFSNIDCFHPSLLAHGYSAKFLWNGLFTPLSNRKNQINYDPSLPFYCPSEKDRIRLD